MTGGACGRRAIVRPDEGLKDGRLALSLVARAQGGDGSAIATLFEACRPLIEAAVRSRLPIRNLPSVDEDDLRQETAKDFIELVQEYHPRKGPLGIYLRRKLKWRLANYLRAERRRSGRGRIPLRPIGAASPTKRHPASARVVRLRGVRLKSALRTLTPRQRAVLHKHHWEGKKVGEVAREMGVAPQAVTAMRRRAEAWLRQRLEKLERGEG